MPYGLYISAEGAQAQNRRMEVVANNLANVDTVGEVDLTLSDEHVEQIGRLGASRPVKSSQSNSEHQP